MMKMLDLFRKKKDTIESKPENTSPDTMTPVDAMRCIRDLPSEYRVHAGAIKFESYHTGVKIYDKVFIAELILRWFKYPWKKVSVDDDERKLNPVSDDIDMYIKDMALILSCLNAIDLPIIRFSINIAPRMFCVDNIVFGVNSEDEKEMDIINTIIANITGGTYEPDTSFAYKLIPDTEEGYIHMEKKNILQSTRNDIKSFVKSAASITFRRVIASESKVISDYENPWKYLDNVGFYVDCEGYGYDLSNTTMSANPKGGNFTIECRNFQLLTDVMIFIKQEFPGIADYITTDKFGDMVLDAKGFMNSRKL